MPSAIIDAAKLDWHSNTKGKWTAFVDDLDAGTPVFDKGYTFTVSGSSITVESDRRPSGVLEYPSTDTNIAPVKELMGIGRAYGYQNGTDLVTYNDTLDLAKGKSLTQIYKMIVTDATSVNTWGSSGPSQYGYTCGIPSSTGNFAQKICPGISNTFVYQPDALWNYNSSTNNNGLQAFVPYSNYAVRFSAQMLGVEDLRVYTNTETAALAKAYATARYQAGNPVVFYAGYKTSAKQVKTDVAPLPLELSHGFNCVIAEDSTTTTNYFEATYDAYEWDEVTYQGCVYLHRHNGVDTRVTGAMNTKKTEHVAAGDMLVNLTLWFGNTTGAVPSNADFYKLFPQWKHQIPPYDEGTLLNYKGTGIRTIGFNAYNPATGTAVLLGGHEYQICGTYTAVSYTDQWGDPEELTLDDHGIFTPLNDGTLTVEGGNSTDTCVHLCWSGYKNYGEPEYKWEPYTELEQSWDLSPFFPDGLNGRAGVFDEMTADERTVKWRKHVFDGTESLPVYGTNTLYWADAEIATAENFAACNLLAPTHVTSSPVEQYRASLSVSSGRVNLQGIYFLAGAEHSLNPLGDVVAWMKARYAAGNPLFVVYPIKTPEVSAVSNAPNFTYNVNDFGTEQSLPVNTVELLSADMNVQIRYSEDFTRLLVHYSDMYPELSALAKDEKAGQIMRIDDTAQNAYNLIDRNAAGTERQFSFDTAGGTQDITDGTAVAKKVMGTTLALNQLVHDTNENSEASADGVMEVTDGVAGPALELKLEGDAYVRNQLVPTDPLAKTVSSSDYAITTDDAIAGPASSLVLHGDSYIRNQYMHHATATWTDNGISLQWTNGYTWKLSGTALAATTGNTRISPTGHVLISDASIKGHTIALYITGDFVHMAMSAYTSTNAIALGKGFFKFVAGGSTFDNYGGILCPMMYTAVDEGTVVNETHTIVAIDLTLLCNDVTSRINAITSWSSLVAQYPEYSNYVLYDQGTLRGVTPSVTACGKNLWANGDQTVSGYTSVNLVNALPPGTYTVSLSVTSDDTDADTCFMLIKDLAGNSRVNHNFQRGVRSSVTFSTTVPIKSALLYSGSTAANSSGDTSAWADIQIERGEEATSYAAYAGGAVSASDALMRIVTKRSSYTADTEDVVNGTRTSRYAKHVFDGTETWGTLGNLFKYTPSDHKGGLDNIMCDRYVTSNAGGYPGMTDRTILGVTGGSGPEIYFRDDAYSTSDMAAWKAHMTGVTLMYEIKTPATTEIQASAVALQADNNTLIQSDGGRKASFDLGYNGRAMTIPLLASRKYAFSDNGVQSIITNASEQAVRTGEDMLVDINQLVNGDSIKVTAITSWADLAVAYHEYYGYVNYNAGEVVGLTPTVQLCSKNLFNRNALASYAYTADTETVDNRTCARIGGRANMDRTGNTIVFKLGNAAFISTSFQVKKAGNNGLLHVLYYYEDGTKFNHYIATTDAWAQVTVASHDPQKKVRAVVFNNGSNGIGAYSTFVDIDTIQIEFGTTATAYEAYYNGGSMTSSAPLYGIGSVRDSEEGVEGKRLSKFGSYTFTGNEGWAQGGTGYESFFYIKIEGAKPSGETMVANYITDITTHAWNAMPDNTAGMKHADGTSARYYVRDSSCATAADMKARMAGKTLYYELETPVESDIEASALTLQNGANTLMQMDGGRMADFALKYTGTDYAIATKSASVYLKNIAGTVERVTGVSSIAVRGGRDNVIDLTRMFGAGLEPGTVADFYKLFPAWMDYKLPYNPGSLLNFRGTGLKSVGFNQWDGTYGVTSSYLKADGTMGPGSAYGVSKYIRAVPGQTYRMLSGQFGAICWYTYDKTYISGTTTGGNSQPHEAVATAPANAYWLRFTIYVPMENATCIYFQWSGPRNGDYEPYWDYTRPIPTLTYFPDGMNGRGSSYDEVTNRQAIRRFATVDLGTLNWTYSGYWYATVSNARKTAGNNEKASIISARYLTGSPNDVVGTSNTISISTGGNILVKTTSTTERPEGLAVYELATPVVTNFDDEISMTARISDFGTEECLPANGYDPVTAPFRGLVLYQDDYARTITKLPENYQSQESMDNLLALLGQLHNGTITATFDSANQVYTYQFTPNA